MNGMQEESSSGFDVKRYLGILQKRKYLALSVAIAVVSLLTWGSFIWPKSYEASSTVFVEKSSVINPLLQGAGVSSNIEDRLKNLRERMTSRNIIERVAKKLDLDATAKSDRYEAFIADVQKNLDVKVKGGRNRETDLFTISYTGRDPKRVSDVVNTLIHEYIEESLGYSRDDTYGAYTFIDSQLQEYKKQLEDSDRAIREFREKNPQLVPQNEATVMTRIEGFETAKIESEIRLKELVRKRDNIKKQLSGEKELTVSSVTREGTPAGRLNSLNNQLLLLMTKYTEDYPEVVKVKSEIEELKKQMTQATSAARETGGAETATLNPIYQQLREEQARTNTEIDSLRARQTELLRQQDVASSALRRMPREQEEWSKLQRDRTALQSIYNDLLQKLERARVSKNLELADKGAAFRIVDPALVPRMPATPNRVQLILLGVLFGIVSGIGAAVGLDYLAPSFKDEDSLAAELKLPVLASIPQIVTEEDVLAGAQLDRKAFMAAGVYLLIIGVVLVEEVLYRYMGLELVKF
jgi:polysaccharide chain length determinant protein (PEP-CTERM system associated)